MKVYENGILRDMTTEEVAEFEKMAAEIAAMPAPKPTAEERIAALEQDNAEIRETLDALLTGPAKETSEKPGRESDGGAVRD